MELLTSPLVRGFDTFIESLDTTCLICSPFITAGPVRRLVTAVEQRQLQDSLAIEIVTDISPTNVLQRSTDLDALIFLVERIQRVRIVYLPRIHAKAYVSGSTLAIVSSANFTDGGLFTNLEYGVLFRDPVLVRRIDSDISQYANLGGTVTTNRLVELRDRVAQLRTIVLDEQRSLDQKLRAAAAELQRSTEDDLIRIRVEGRTIHAIFAETILYLLSRYPLTTEQLHQHIRGIHPDLCDDSIDRVIDGHRFGKLWKHQVRTAQQHLKRTRMIAYDRDDRIWRYLPQSR